MIQQSNTTSVAVHPPPISSTSQIKLQVQLITSPTIYHGYTYHKAVCIYIYIYHSVNIQIYMYIHKVVDTHPTIEYYRFYISTYHNPGSFSPSDHHHFGASLYGIYGPSPSVKGNFQSMSSFPNLPSFGSVVHSPGPLTELAHLYPYKYISCIFT